MIVPEWVYSPEVTLAATGDVFLGGQIGGWQEPEPKHERHPIGFRMRESAAQQLVAHLLDFVV